MFKIIGADISGNVYGIFYLQKKQKWGKPYIVGTLEKKHWLNVKNKYWINNNGEKLKIINKLYIPKIKIRTK